ncbi:hypothetical protein F511_19799 [Dorcoceras hygrometricum]|uniref:Uncharacterized protein n=1 Tax=Dorcoceras hygrometricum TaxID=472368 RepID=A0A2Z7B168_9LAMI|nr:hypothetical protein F511_19799 [Dorcoceras hygrometricum]
MIWFLSTAILSGIVCLCAPYYGTLEALPIYALSIFGSTLLFYVYSICDDEDCFVVVGKGNAFCRKGGRVVGKNSLAIY